MKIFSWINIRLALMITMVIFMYSFTSHRNEMRKIKKTVVVFEGKNTLFLKEEVVNKLLIEKNQDIKTLTKVDLDLMKLEKSVNQQEMVQNADVFVSVDGVLKAIVKQKVPIARVINQQGSFYLDSEGNKMSLSNNYSARVPLISGEIGAVKKDKIAEVLNKICKDDFLKKNIIGIQVLSNGSLVMMTRNYDFQIDFGRTVNIERKFENYKAFFQNAVLDSTLNKYKRINLKFTKQVVCIK